MMTKSDFEIWSAELSEVEKLIEDEHFNCFSKLTDKITGKEDVAFLRRLIKAVCVVDDFGVYEGLYNAMWLFPGDLTAAELARALPGWAVPEQVQFFYPILHTPERLDAFIQTALQWNTDERQLGCKFIYSWSWHNQKDEEGWKPVLKVLDWELVPEMPEDSIPKNWPLELQEKLASWRELPPGNISKKVFWEGKDREVWRNELPFLMEALSLSQGKKWRDIKAWLNPFHYFAKELYPDFLDMFEKVSSTMRERAIVNIKRIYLPERLAGNGKWVQEWVKLIQDLEAINTDG